MSEIRTHDLQGRLYAKLSELKPGDRIVTDGDFTCREPWSEATVKERENGDLFVDCQEGGHKLDSHLEEDQDTLLGIYRAKDFNT